MTNAANLSALGSNVTTAGNISSASTLTLQTNSTTAVTIDSSQRAAFVAGTAALPSITTIGDTDTGIWFPAANTVASSTGGTERMRIDSSGNVGIGTAGPAAKLEVQGSVRIGNATAAGSLSMPDLAGNPTLQLVTDTATAGSCAIVNNWGAAANIGVVTGTVRGDGTAFQVQTAIPITSGLPSGAGTTAFHVGGNGYVGINTTNPLDRFEMAGASGNILSSDGGFFGGGVYYGGSPPNWRNTVASQGGWAVRNSGGVCTFFTGASPGAAGSEITTMAERMRIDSTGNVGIGTSSPSYKLDVTGVARLGNGVTAIAPSATDIPSTSHTMLSGTGGNGLFFGQYPVGQSYAQWIQSSYVNPTTATYNLILQPLGGNVGIGTSTLSGTYKLQVSGLISDSKGDVRAAPIQSKTAAYVLVASDAGQTISITTGGVTVNASVLSAGDMVSIFNNSGSSQTITQGTSVTLRLSGTATTGNRTLAQYGVATLLCVIGGATPTFACTGAGLT
jgi:hypothetical protein